MVAPSSPKKRQSHWPMPPAAPVMAMVLPANVPLMPAPQRIADPGEVGAAQMAPVVEGQLIDAALAQRCDGGQELALGREVGVGGAQDAAQRPVPRRRRRMSKRSAFTRMALGS